jgi:predicted phosphohydrolase
MAIYAIGDLHLSLTANKAMDCFAGWQDYVKRIQTGWRSVVRPEDTVVIPGDISWGMSLAESEADFALIHQLPGSKLLLKGNHDYWWTSMAKMESFLTEKGLTSLKILHNNCAAVGSIVICGTRGWMFEAGEAHDLKITAREAGRLERSLRCGVQTGLEPVAFLHYPPLLGDQIAGEMIDLMRAYGVKRCYYGHVHGDAGRFAFQGTYLGINFTLVAADGVNFTPVRVEP